MTKQRSQKRGKFMLIEGKKSSAAVYTQVIEQEAIEQIQTLCDQEFTQGSKICVMPDVHVGKGCTIGMTMTITDKVVPNIVGVDIGCGMYTVNLGKIDLDLPKLDEVVHTIPSGKRVWEGRKMHFDLTILRSYRMLKDTRRMERSLGTLGGGNHFIEIERSKDGDYYLIIHTGSRNLGKQVAEQYQKLAIELQHGKENYYKKRKEMIREYKQAGRRAELQEALKQLKWEKKESAIPNELCFLYGEYMQDYLEDIKICQSFAKINRELIASIILDNMKIEPIESFHTIHNYIDVEEMILRKGAISAHKGEKVLIPINMRDGSILAIGKGNKDWNESAPHGAGRVLSRGEAKEKLTIEKYKEQMKGIYSTSVNESTLDESPMAYKAIEHITKVIKDSVNIIDIMKPVYNFKASSETMISR